MSDLETIGDLCEAIANPTPPKVERRLHLFDLEHQSDPSDVLTLDLRARHVPGPLRHPARGLLRGEAVAPDVPEDWLIVFGEPGDLTDQ